MADGAFRNFQKAAPVDVTDTPFGQPKGLLDVLPQWLTGRQTPAQQRAVDPQAMGHDKFVFDGGGTATRESNLQWGEALASPMQRKVGEALGGETGSKAMMLAQFLSPAMRAPLLRPTAKLAMDPASVAARVKAMGYDNGAFYRGEASRPMPKEYAGAYFSREPETATGFANRGGQDAPREFRLNLDKAIVDHEPMTAAQYAKIVDAVSKGDANFAHSMVQDIATNPKNGVEWMREFARRNPDMPVTETGGRVLQMVEKGTGNRNSVLKDAGFDTIDYGQYVEKIAGDGIRLAGAKFNPSKASSKNITAGIAGASAVPAVVDGVRRSIEDY